MYFCLKKENKGKINGKVAKMCYKQLKRAEMQLKLANAKFKLPQRCCQQPKQKFTNKV